MAKSNAERQALFQQRRKERIDKCVTGEDVVEAARLLWQAHASDPLNQVEGTWDDFVLKCRSRRGGGLWLDILPDSGDPEDYDGFSESERALLVRVGAIVRAVKLPPGT